MFAPARPLIRDAFANLCVISKHSNNGQTHCSLQSCNIYKFFTIAIAHYVPSRLKVWSVKLCNENVINQCSYKPWQYNYTRIFWVPHEVLSKERRGGFLAFRHHCYCSRNLNVCNYPSGAHLHMLYATLVPCASGGCENTPKTVCVKNNSEYENNFTLIFLRHTIFTFVKIMI